ncbi:IS66 family insertion sequence element accessory protein TnpA [Hungatella effluvii]
MENKYLRHTDDEWLAIINECRSSGNSDRIWCQEHRITLSTSYY